MTQQEYMKLKEHCDALNFEITIIGQQLCIIGAEITERDKQQIRNFIPINVPYMFQEGPKLTTLESVKILAMRNRIEHIELKSPDLKKRKLNIIVQGDLEISIMEKIQAILEDDGYFKNILFIINNEVVDLSTCKKIREQLDQVQNRQVISQDDILNLQIALGSTSNIDDFLSTL